MKKRVFIAHPVGLDDAVLGPLKAEIEAKLKPLLDPDVEMEIVLGRDDFARNVPIYGGWAGWVQAVAEGIVMDITGPRNLFDGYIVAPYSTVGKATAEILSRALARGKNVYRYVEGAFSPVHHVVRTDPEDNRAGWRVE